MENLQNKYGIVLDGKMDEPIWQTVKEYTGFRLPRSNGGELRPWQTFFKIVPCEDRIYVGARCEEGEEMQTVLENRYRSNAYNGSSIELFFSPSGTDYEFYQFLVTINGQTEGRYYSECGNIQPDKYAPEWNSAVYIGDTYWSIEVEIPLTAFYWTQDSRWSSKWLFNMCRNRNVGRGCHYSTWSLTDFGYLEPHHFTPFENMPVRPVEDDVCMISAVTDLTDKTAEGYKGMMTIKATCAVDNSFTFSSDYAETTEVTLTAGSNEFSVPCTFPEEGRIDVPMVLTRNSDGKVFKRYYPTLVQFEPIKVKFTLPEYRNNFYPGQNYTKIVGTAISAKPITLTLEGPGIPAKTITPNADGSFAFDTPDFQEGEAWLTATIDGFELKKKIRRLAPTGHTMAWISGGNLVVNGKPVLRRDMYARYYRMGEACKRKYDADDLHETMDIFSQCGCFEPSDLVKGSEGAGGEATFDQMPSEEMLRAVDRVIENAKGKDFTHYYLSDEPECRGLSPVYFKHLYEYIIDKDPYHLLLIASRAADENVEFADWFETHPYICPFNHPDGRRTYLRPFHSLGKYVDDIVNLNRPDKCIGFLPTCYASKGSAAGYDYPTLDEYICHTWAAMMHGGKSLWPYAGHDLNDRASIYEGTRYIFTTFEALEDIVLFGKRTTLHKTLDAEAVLYEYNDEKMFVLCNYTQQPQTVTLEGISGTWHEFRGNRVITDYTFNLKPMGTIVATTKVRDENLPTYDEVAALVDKMEYERKHTGNLLFEREHDIIIKASENHHMYTYKVLDGVRDNQGYWMRQKGDKFVEMDLSKVKPTFTKVCIYGHNLDTLQIFVGKEGQLEPLEYKDLEIAEFSRIYTLDQAITPDVLRLELSTNDVVEFYEIEVHA